MVEWFPSALPSAGVKLGTPYVFSEAKREARPDGGGQQGDFRSVSKVMRWGWENDVMALCCGDSGGLCGADDVAIARWPIPDH